MRVSRVDRHSPVFVLPLQLDAELHLLRRDKAESGVIDLQIASTRLADAVSKLAAPASSANKLVVRDNLLDVYRRREFVESKMTRIDDLDAFSRDEPQFAISGLRDGRTEGGRRNRGGA